jgi:hypothetical protein
MLNGDHLTARISATHPALRSMTASVIAYLRQPLRPAAVPAPIRLVASVLVAVAAAIFAYHQLVGRGWLASDFEFDLRAARRLMEGLDVYNDPSVGGAFPYPFDAQFPYPIFAALIAIPFVPLSSYVAGALFVGFISGLLAFAVSRDGWWRLAVFISPCYFVAASVANWSPLLVASAFIPTLYPFAIAKPTLAFPIIANFPNMRAYLLCAGLILLSLLLVPTWPIGWLSSLQSQQAHKYWVPILVGPTALVLVGAVWWRFRPARLLVMFAFVPQHPFFYDQLVLWLLPQSLRQSLALSAAGWAAYLGWALVDPQFDPLLAKTPHGPGLEWTAPLFYLPALILVAWQKLIWIPRMRQREQEAWT